jgi:hypothetical protein
MVVLAAIVCGASLRTMAQQKEGNPAGDKGLPDAPAAGVSPRVPTASVSGTVLDANGDVIQGATVSLVAMSGGAQRTLISGENGQFTFAGVAAGSFRVIVTGQGMGRFDSGEFTLQAGDVHTISQAILPVSAGSTDVRVVGNREELAEEQVHIAIDQRVLGVLPNFYSTYNWNAPPMGSKQKFHLAFRAVTDPVAFVGVGVAAGFEQMNNTFPGYGAGAQGFGKRFGAAYADDLCCTRTHDTSTRVREAYDRGRYMRSKQHSFAGETMGVPSQITPIYWAALRLAESQIFTTRRPAEGCP